MIACDYEDTKEWFLVLDLHENHVESGTVVIAANQKQDKNNIYLSWNNTRRQIS